MRPDFEPQPEYKRLISWSNPRVWLRELMYAISDWLTKRTEAEIAHREAAYAELIAWSGRARHSAVCAMEGDAATCPCQKPISADNSNCDPGLGAH